MFASHISDRARMVRDCLVGNAPHDPAGADSHDRTPTVLFYACIALYSVYLATMQPQWVFAGEMWAEMATNYFVNANAPSLWTQLLATDAGYVPLPQRLIALAAHALNVPAASIPYVYTWSAIAISAALVGSFCLRPFRLLIESDALRFLVAISILLVADFETRTFISFTYFVAFFAAIVAALAMVAKPVQVPRWTWWIPLLMVSKPAALCALPAMVLAAFVSGGRYRRVVAVSVLLCLMQGVLMVFRVSPGPGSVITQFGFFEKATAGLAYGMGFSGGYFFGKGFAQQLGALVWCGVAVLGFCVWTVYFKRTRANALVLVGLSLVFFNTGLNAFAMSDSWNLDMQRLQGLPLYRHVIVAYFGITLVVAGAVATWSQGNQSGRLTRGRWFAPALFLVWFLASGWWNSAGSLSRAPGPPTLYNSQWQSMAGVLDTSEPVCVPVDPIGWIYQRGCLLLNGDVSWGKSYHFEALPLTQGRAVLVLPVPLFGPNASLMSLAVLVQPAAHQAYAIQANAKFKMRDGTTNVLWGVREVSAAGGLLHLTARKAYPLKDIESIALEFDVPVQLGHVGDGALAKPAVLWMGN